MRPRDKATDDSPSLWYRKKKKKEKRKKEKARQKTLPLEFCFFCYTVEPCLTATSLPLFFGCLSKTAIHFLVKKTLVNTATR